MLFSSAQRGIAEAFSRLLYCNPFLPERVDGERAILGREFVESDSAWNVFRDSSGERPNVLRLQETAESHAQAARQRLLDGSSAQDR